MSESIRRNDDLFLSDALRRRLVMEGEFEGGPGLFWAIMRRSNGLTVPLKAHVGMASPSEDQQIFAHDMAMLMNKEIHHDGSWIVGFTHPSGAIYIAPGAGISMTVPFDRCIFLWLDEDGDPQFAVDVVQPFYEVIMAGPETWIESSEKAWQAWNHHMREVLDVKGRHAEGVTFKRAQGERRPSGR